jgi:hypothetical protein
MRANKSRLDDAVRLRNAARELLRRKGVREGGGARFNLASPTDPYPRLSLSVCRFSPDGRLSLSVWAWRGNWYGKVMNIEWLGERIELVSFKRGEWEAELLAMGGADGVAVH